MSRLGLVVRRSASKSKATQVRLSVSVHLSLQKPVRRLGLVVRRSAGKRKDVGSTPRFGTSPSSSKIVIDGHLSRDFALHN